MGDEHDGAAGPPDPFELLVQQVAGDRVERGERLVHQQHRAVLRERAGQGDALAHAAGQLVRALVRGIAQIDQVEQFEGPGPALGARTPRSLSASSTFPAVSQGNSADSWNITAAPPPGL